VRLAKTLGESSFPISHFQEIPGSGIEGVVAGHKILLGSRNWLEKKSVFCSSRGNGAQTSLVNNLEPPHVGSYSCVSVDGIFLGTFSLTNTLRPEVEQLIAQLGNRYQLALLSGDNEREAARFGKLFGGRATLQFNQSPADKLNFIRQLQDSGRTVMMVGDGLNDAGALRQADVGVAVVEQIGVFSPASDVILDAAELPHLAQVLRFCQSAARVVRAGFLLSAFYNLAGISIAAAGLLSPVVCAILMPLSSATMVVFACGLTAWSGRKLSDARLKIENAIPPEPGPSTFNTQLVTKEAA
jgi:Cu+-exporting ATPase